MRKRTKFEQVRDAFWYGIPVAGLLLIAPFAILWSIILDFRPSTRRRPF